MLKISRFVFNMFEENTYVVYDPEAKVCVIIDPGMYHEEEREALDQFIQRQGLTVIGLINTHMHVDHTFGDHYVKDKYGVKIQAGANDAHLGLIMPQQAARFGMHKVKDPIETDVTLQGGDVIPVGSGELQVIDVPGHSPGSIALYSPQGFVLTGDALFKGSIGRTDLFEGNHTQLVESIRNRLFTLPPDTVVLPGHGPETTIGQEESTNPFL